MTSPPRRKKLIEVALPLEAINAASAREKSIRHGHPSTLHLWWARRPLAACRAVLFSSLVDDPSSDPAYHGPDGSVDEDRAGARRAELFNLIEELVKWENSNNASVINAARAEIASSIASRKVELGELKKDTIVFGKHEGDAHPDGPFAADGRTAWTLMLRRSKREIVDHFLVNYAPPVLDPFAGGGSIPLEAQRLGLRAFASDLNPVAVLINKALIEIPPKFANQPPVHPKADRRTGWTGATGLAKDVRHYGEWMRDEAERRIGHLYPRVRITDAMVARRAALEPYRGQDLKIIAWLWARTVRSPDPALEGKHTPLVRSFWLSKKKGKEAYVFPVVDQSKGEFRFVVESGKPKDGFDPGYGTVERTGGRCLLSKSPMPFSHIRNEGKAGRMKTRLMAIVAEGSRGRVYIDPLSDHEEIALTAEPVWRPVDPLPTNPRDFKTPNYGMNTFGDLFTSRQLTALSILSDLIRDTRARSLADANAAGIKDPVGYSDAIATYMAFSLSKAADYWSSLCSWHSSKELIRNTFGRQALPMVWDFAEANPFQSGTGGFGCSWSEKVLVALVPNSISYAKQANAIAAACDIHKPILSTDPPYYDNICYAELSDYFYLWLRRSLHEVYPDLLGTLLTPKSDELIANPYRHGGSKTQAAAFFESGLGSVIEHWREDGHPEIPTSIFYAFKQVETNTSGTASTGWETFLTGVIEHGFAITATWPMRTEMGNRMIGSGKNALASSIVLACVPRELDAPMATRREFSSALREDLLVAIRHLQTGNVAPVDLAQASIGPGMAIFSRYRSVLNTDGSPMTVREALLMINHTLDEVLAEQEADYDRDTRWAVKWFEQYGVEAGPFGEAETLSTALNLSVAGVTEAGIAESGRGKVRLFKRDELDPNWSLESDARLTVWEIAHYLIRVLMEDGETAAADLLRRTRESPKAGSAMVEAARELAYRLYQICERKKWAKEALGYNSLIVAWPDIERQSGKRPVAAGETQTEIFE